MYYFPLILFCNRRPWEIANFSFKPRFGRTKVIVPTPLEGWGTIYSTGFFFVQSIFTDRYIHRRELWVLSLKSPSSVEYGFKKIFLIFVFYRELSRIEVLWKVDGNPLFLFTFSGFLSKFSSILLKFVNFYKNNAVGFTFQYSGGLPISFIRVFWLSWFQFLWILDRLRYFYSNFPDFLPKILSNLLKIVKIVNNNTFQFVFRDKKSCWLFWFDFFG